MTSNGEQWRGCIAHNTFSVAEAHLICPGNKMSTDELIVQARARIIWGDEPTSVRYLLTSNGMSFADAVTKIQEFVAERTKEIRKAGLRSACIGTAILCACAGLIYYELNHPSTRFPSRQGKAMFFVALVGFFGLWKLINGLVYLLRPKSETRSISEVSD